MKDALNYWWRLLKLTVAVVIGPIVLYILLHWAGVLG